ncbi:hypothetical protein AJ79_09853 [Helicocarpus griseus UAMH5409]|uniref:Glucose-methanol-choline oxidoreductase N-terminal domain-containing protein n=1 Tax=Helicocarpus griseus UAMH5409 TaxID=1447875 RepID=A0A2B7WGN3_9EURO|nr:hypothetical protein AJ79_09853 [Helicocarpus griseus UAMH5409]
MFGRTLRALLSLYFSAAANAHPAAKYARVVDSTTVSKTKYDFIVVGGGTGGLTVADRLTEDPNTSVLVIEYGPFDQGEEDILVPGLYNPGKYLWPNIFSTSQRALNNASSFVPMGAVVGGGSTVNAMMFRAAAAIDYDHWERLGGWGWGWGGMLPYFKKSETFTPPDPEFAKKHNISWDASIHGYDGPIYASFSGYDYPSSKNFWDAAVSLKISQPEGPQEETGSGLCVLLRAMHPETKSRSYSRIGHFVGYVSYFDRVAKARSNYHIITEHAVSKILFDKRKAVGVEYISRETAEVLRTKVKKEVIMAAGSIHSPQILQLSGIGPKALLESLKIETIVDIPGVGQNLQDHLDLKINYTCAYTLLRTRGNNIALLPLKNSTTLSTYDTITLPPFPPQSTYPSVIQGYDAQRQLLLDSYASYQTSVGSISWDTGPQTTVYMVKPLSRGSVSINSTSVLDKPLIDFGAVTDPTDLDVLLALSRRNREITATPPMQALGPVEGAPAGGIADDDADGLREAIRASLAPTNAHMCCTLAMMEREMGGVVDGDLKVYGVEGVSVADASWWPVIPAGAPHASIYTAGEREYLNWNSVLTWFILSCGPC